MRPSAGSSAAKRRPPTTPHAAAAPVSLRKSRRDPVMNLSRSAARSRSRLVRRAPEVPNRYPSRQRTRPTEDYRPRLPQGQATWQQPGGSSLPPPKSPAEPDETSDGRSGFRIQRHLQVGEPGSAAQVILEPF